MTVLPFTPYPIGEWKVLLREDYSNYQQGLNTKGSSTQTKLRVTTSILKFLKPKHKNIYESTANNLEKNKKKT